MKPLANLILLLSAIFMMPGNIWAAEAPDTTITEVDEEIEIPGAGTADLSAISIDTSYAGTLAAMTPPDSIEEMNEEEISLYRKLRPRASIYELPYSLTTSEKNWKRLWVNTSVFAGAYITTLVVLECLPEDATNWNRAEIQSVPPFTRWYNHVIKEGPEVDGDNPVFNYILHPYAGAVYFMAARSCGFNYFQSLLYSACVSTIGWEFGIEGFMERPSIQDIFITPLVGSAIGECFYILKRHIVSHDYTLFGSRIAGNVVAFLIDPVNEVVGLFGGNDARKLHLGRKGPKVESSLMPTVFPTGQAGLSFTCRF
ncbi:MAG: DUF3943 domain-containing protein [Muribaculaceae bacterium]|nr:DUF3943 domain-containing protein [Muribaculaceae bacterium]